MQTIDHDNVSLYCETLFALARDAWRQDRREAFDFVKSYLVGLVPSSALQAFCDDLAPVALDRSKPRPNGHGGALVTNPVPDKPLSPVGGLAVKW